MHALPAVILRAVPWPRLGRGGLGVRAVVVALGAVACGPDLPVPRLERVSPSRGWTGEDTEVAVIGSRFYPEVRVAGDSPTDVDRDFALSLLTSPPTELRDVSLVSYRELQARVPAGVEPGRYDLSLTSPEGDESVLVDAYTVTSTRADRIDLSTPNINLLVGQYGSVALQVEDPEGDEVPLAVPVRITVEAESGSAEAVDLRAGLDELEEVEPGVVEGRLGDGGRATLQLTSAQVDRLRVRVQGLGESDYLEGSSEWIDFRPLSVDKIELEVISDDGRTEAGAPVPLVVRLLDRDGSPTRGELVWVALRETCPGLAGAFERLIAVEDEAVISDAFLTGATDGERCRSNRFAALATVGSAALSAESVELAVSAAEASAYDVDLGGAEVEAGGTELPLWVVARDGFGNRARTHTATLALRDDRGGLDTRTGIGTGGCGAFVEGAAVCGAGPIIAHPTVRVQALDERGRVGWSDPFTVEPGPLEGIEVQIGATEVPAGGPLSVDLRGVDAYDNGVEMGLLTVNPPNFTARGAVSCTPGSPTGAAGQSRWPCTFTQALAEEQLTVEASASGHVGQSEVFAVTNGPLAVVQVETSATTLTAGDELSYELQAEDAWGNPYTTGGVRSLDLSDEAGELGVQSVPLSADGSATGVVRLTRATPENRLVFQSGGAPLGSSAPFAVEPGPHAAYQLELDATWAEVDEALWLEVVAQDQWGNTIPDHDTVASLESAGGFGAAVEVGAFEGGVAEASFVYDEVAIGDVLTLDDGTIQASSGLVDAVELSCGDGPEAAVVLDGSSERVLCLISGSTPSVSISAAGSSAGGAGLSAYHFAEGDSWIRTTGPLRTTAWSEAGAHLVTVLVVDSAGCGASAEALAWVGPNDGEPVGPVELSLGTTSLSSSSSGAGGQTTVALAATDCAGDPASGGTLLVRAELGQLSSASSALTATGQGLALTLDATGSGAVDWSVSGEGVATRAGVHAGVATGAAHGVVEATISGDETRPQVVEWWPVGRQTAAIDEVEVQFSEPLWSATVDDSRVTVLDASGSEVALESLELSTDGQSIVARPATPLDPATGSWSLWLSSSIRDDAGNRLDGAWAGGASEGELAFGGVAEAAPAVTGCAPSTATFRPDGDAGTAAEAEQVQVLATAASVPSWWRLDVIDSTGARVAQQVVVGSSTAQTLSWDGRSNGAGVVENGLYSVVIEALDDLPAPGASCGFSVRIDNHVRPPE